MPQFRPKVRAKRKSRPKPYGHSKAQIEILKFHWNSKLKKAGLGTALSPLPQKIPWELVKRRRKSECHATSETRGTEPTPRQDGTTKPACASAGLKASGALPRKW